MRCWRPILTRPGSKRARSSSNGARSTACVRPWGRSQRSHFCGHVCRARSFSCKASPLPIAPDLSNEAAGALRYAYKASLIGAAYQFELTEQGLSWRMAGRSGVWPYADIATVRLSFRPVSMQSRRFRADIENADGARIVIFSTSWQTAALMAPQDQQYRAFMTQLHARMARAGSRALLIGGLGPRVYAAAIICVTLVAVAMAGLFVRSIATGEWAGALFLVGFAALFAWQVGGFITRNRPLAYSFDRLPKALLP